MILVSPASLSFIFLGESVDEALDGHFDHAVLRVNLRVTLGDKLHSLDWANVIQVIMCRILTLYLNITPTLVTPDILQITVHLPGPALPLLIGHVIIVKCWLSIPTQLMQDGQGLLREDGSPELEPGLLARQEARPC